MSTLLIVLLGIVGFVVLAGGVLVWLFFHQGGCCIRKAKEKICRKSMPSPAVR